MISINRVDGIDKINFDTDEERDRIINCHGRKSVNFDIVLDKNREYTFNVTSSNGEEKQETLILTNDILENQVIVTYDEYSNGQAKFNVNYDNISPDNSSERRLYFSIDGTTWTQYTNPLAVDITKADVSTGYKKVY